MSSTHSWKRALATTVQRSARQETHGQNQNPVITVTALCWLLQLALPAKQGHLLLHTAGRDIKQRPLPSVTSTHFPPLPFKSLTKEPQFGAAASLAACSRLAGGSFQNYTVNQIYRRFVLGRSWKSCIRYQKLQCNRQKMANLPPSSQRYPICNRECENLTTHLKLSLLIL